MLSRISPNYDFNTLCKAILPAKTSAKEELREYFTTATGHAYCHLFRYGRAGLYYLLKALGFKDKEIVLPAYTCVVVANAIIASGNIPVFVDNAFNGFQPSHKEYHTAVNEKTGMVIVTHLFGITADVKGLYNDIKQYNQNIFVLADCAHSFFCKFPDGSSVFEEADGALFGMNISKLINSVVGGAITVREDSISRTLKKESQALLPAAPFSIVSRLYVFASAFGFTRLGYGIIKKLIPLVPYLRKQVEYYEEDSAGLPQDYNREMSDFEATIGLDSSKKYLTRIERRRQHVNKYLELINVSPQLIKIKLPPVHDGCSWSHLPLLLPETLAGQHRDAIITRLEKKHAIELGKIVDYSICDLSFYKKRLQISCPIASQTASRVINLPLTQNEGLFSSKKSKGLSQIVTWLTIEMNHHGNQE